MLNTQLPKYARRRKTMPKLTHATIINNPTRPVHRQKRNTWLFTLISAVVVMFLLALSTAA